MNVISSISKCNLYLDFVTKWVWGKLLRPSHCRHHLWWSFLWHMQVSGCLINDIEIIASKLCPFYKRILSFRTSIFKLSVSPSFYMLSPSTHKSVFHFDSFLACSVKACFCHALKEKKSFSDSSLSDDGVMWKRVRMAIPNTSHYKKCMYIYISFLWKLGRYEA